MLTQSPLGRHASNDVIFLSSSPSSLSEAQRSSLDQARGLYEVPLTDDLLTCHAENQKQVAAAIHEFFESQPGVVFPQDRPSMLAENLYEVLLKSKFNPDIYLPKDTGHVHGYGKYLLYTDGNAGVPYCLQIFAFGGGQKTPIHDHPCDCTSVVFKGALKERLYLALDDGSASKIKKQERLTRSKAQLSPDVSNIHSIKNPSRTESALSVHLYRLDGVRRQAAVNNVYERAAKSDFAQSALRA